MQFMSSPVDALAAGPDVDVQIVVAGQSWVSLMRNTALYSGLVDTLKTAIGDPSADNIYLNMADYGGSSVLLANERNDVAPGTYYWAGVPSPFSDGPLLTLGKTTINTNIAVQDVLCDIWLQSQGDSVEMTPGDTTSAAQWREATLYVINELAKLSNADAPEDVVTFVDLEGRRNSFANTGSITMLRDQRLAMIRDNSNLRFGMEAYDIPLPAANDHPESPDAWHFGFRLGLAIANEFYDATNPLGPTITGVTRESANVLKVSISTETGMTLRKPAAPVGFRAFAGADYITGAENPITGYSWTGNDLYLTLTNSGQVTLCYPYDSIPEMSGLYLPGGSETSFIRYSTKLDPRDIGLPLRSMISTTVAAA